MLTPSGSWSTQQLTEFLAAVSSCPDEAAAVRAAVERAAEALESEVGHAAGDQLLVAAGERLRSTVGEADTAARFGGDEFAILLEDEGPTSSTSSAAWAASSGRAICSPSRWRARSWPRCCAAAPCWPPRRSPVERRLVAPWSERVA